MKPTGGAAFPMPSGPEPRVDVTTHYNEGMTLRDYFAAAALSGICGDGIPGSHHHPERTAEAAYRYADAMLAERAKE